MRNRIFIVLTLIILSSTYLFAETYEGLSFINNTNYVKYFTDYLGYFYNSHGCLHFSPSDIYLLHKTIPKGIPFQIKSYKEKSPPAELTAAPYFNDLINNPSDLNQAKTWLVANRTKVIVYPALGRLYILVNDAPYAQVKTLAGLPFNYSMVFNIENGKPISWDPVLSTPTDPGNYKTFGTSSHYISSTYYNTTIVPFGAWLAKGLSGWAFQMGKKWYAVPKNIVSDLKLPYGENDYNYHDVNVDNDGYVISARWGSHDFGKYVLFWTKNGKTFYPEIGYAAGELLFEQIILVKDLAQILTSSGSDEFSDCVERNENFRTYKAICEFVASSGETQSNLLDPTACAYYRLVNGLGIRPDERGLIDPRLLNTYYAVKSNSLPKERSARKKTLGLYVYLKDYDLLFRKQAYWYKKLYDDWEFWKDFRLKLRDNFRALKVYSLANRQLNVERWLNDRLEFKLAVVPRQMLKRGKISFTSFFKTEEDLPPFLEREKEALRGIIQLAATKEVEFLELNSVNALNDYNFGVLHNKMLGNLYKSHGCLHVSPRNMYFLYQMLPIGAKITIHDYSKKPEEGKFKEVEFLADQINFQEDLEQLEKSFKNPADVNIEVYPGTGLWVIYFKNKPFAKLLVEGGPRQKYYLVENRQKNGFPVFEKSIAYPTTPGIFYVFSKTEDHVSNLYYDLTIMPMGAQLKKSKTGWIFEDLKGKWRLVPKDIQNDLNLPAEKRKFDYYDKVKDGEGNLIMAKWGSHPFGRYVIMQSANRRTPSPEFIHSSGDLIMEQRQLVSDLIKILSAPVDSLEACIKYSRNFGLYKTCYDFVNNPEGVDELETIESGGYKLYFDLPLSSEETEALPPDALIANKYLKKQGELTEEEINLLVKEGVAVRHGKTAVIDEEKILGIQFDTYGYVVAIRKFANHYSVLKKHWPELTELRRALLKDFRNFAIKDPIVFRRFTRELMQRRINLKRLTKQDAFKVISELLEQQESEED